MNKDIKPPSSPGAHVSDNAPLNVEKSTCKSFTISTTELQSLIKNTLKETLKEERAGFYIEPELHYNHHKEIEKFFERLNSNIKIAWRVAIVITTTTILGLFGSGFYFYISQVK